MDSQLPTNQEEPQTQITPEQLEQMKMMARQQAIQQVVQQKQLEQQQKNVYVTINLTVAEVIFVSAPTLVFGNSLFAPHTILTTPGPPPL